MTAVQTEPNYHNGGTLNMIPISAVQKKYIPKFKLYIDKKTEKSLNNIMNTDFQPRYPKMETFEIPKGLNGFTETFVKPCPLPTTNCKTADITSLSVNSSKNSKKMPETRENTPNTRYPIMDPGKHRQVNCINFNKKLCQSIEEAVQNISRFWQSGYSNRNGIRLPETFWDMGPYWAPPFYPPANQSIYPGHPYMPHSFHSPNLHYQPLQTNHCMSSKRPQGINNMKKMFNPAKIKKTYEETHWFKVKNTRVPTPNRTESCNIIVESTKEILNPAMSPVITLPSTCKSKDYNNNTKKTGMSLDCAATSGDLAANKGQMPDIDQQVCKPNYHNKRFEDSSINSYDSGFSSECHDNGYQADIEADNFEFEGCQDHSPLSPKIPGFDRNSLFSNSDAEITIISSNDELPFIKNPNNESKDEVKNTRIDPQNLTKEDNKVLKMNRKPLTPVLSDPTLMSSCKSQQNGYNLKADIYYLATSGDLAANSCQIPTILKQNENEIYSFSDSSFSSVYHKNDFESDIESDDSFSKDPLHFSVTPPRFGTDLLPSNSLDSDTESSDLSEDDEDCNNDLERSYDEIDSYLHPRWLIRSSSDDSLVFSQDDEDDWDTIWSSNLQEEPNDFILMREFNPITVAFTTCCAASSSIEEKADVPAVEADDGIHQKIKEANEKWNKVYNNDFDLDSTSKDDHTPKVQFATGEKLTTRHLLVCWTYAYKAARIGPWITLALDSQRFQKRIEELKPTIDPILDPVHRQNIFTSRLQQEAERM